jgi:putative oxidoreductase
MTTLFAQSHVATAAPFGPSTTSRARTVALWATQIVVAGMFLYSGGLKLAGAAVMVGLFEAIGIGQWFRYLTGSIEVVAALLLLTPRLALFGALLAIPTMIGAVATHVFIVGGSPMPALVLLAGSSAIAWVRRHQFTEWK